MARKVVQVLGVEKVVLQIKLGDKEMARRFQNGAYKAGLLLQRFSQQIVPVDTGQLKNTARTDRQGTGYKASALVSYGTNYGIYVHEDLEARHAEGKQAKFLEQPARERRGEIIAVIAKEIQGRANL